MAPKYDKELYASFLNSMKEAKKTPFKSLTRTLGPQGKIGNEINESKAEYDANAISPEEYPEGVDEDMVTAMLIGAMFDPDRLNKSLSGSTAYQDQVGFNQLYILENIAQNRVTGKTTVMPILTEARKEVKAALAEYKKGNYGPAKEMLDRFINYAYSNEAVISEDADAENNHYAGMVYAPNHVNILLANKVMGKPPVNAVGNGSAIEKARQRIYEKQFGATERSFELRSHLLDDFDALPQDETARGNIVSELIFNQILAASSYQSKQARDLERKRITDSALKKYGIEQGQHNEYYDDLEMRNNKMLDVQFDLHRILRSYHINKLEGVLAEEDGIEKLKAIYMPLIKNSDHYKTLMAAKTRDDMQAAIETVDDNIYTKAKRGEAEFDEALLPDDADKYNKKLGAEYKGSLENCNKTYDRIIVDYLSKQEEYAAYNLKDLSDESLRTNAENMYDLFKLVDKHEGFNWFGSGDPAYTELRDKVQELYKSAKDMGDPAKPLDVKKLTAYLMLEEEATSLADKYLKENAANTSNEIKDKKAAVTELLRIASVNMASVEKQKRVQLMKDAEAIGADKILEESFRVNKYTENGQAKNTFNGTRYRNTAIYTGAAGYMLGRWTSVSITIMALAATGKYTLDELVDEDKLVAEKEMMHDEVVRRGMNNTPENQKWIAENIYKGQKVLKDMIDEACKDIDYTSPDYENTDYYAKVEWLKFMRFDAWQEMSHCKPEIVELAHAENPNINDYNDLKEDQNLTFGLSTRNSQANYAHTINSYLMGEVDGNIMVLSSQSFEYYKKKELIDEYRRANPDKKESEISTKSLDMTLSFLGTYAMESGLKRVANALNDDKKLEDALLKNVIDGTLFQDIKVKYDKNAEIPIPEYEGLEDLAALLETHDIDYIKNKLADKSYLTSNSMENRLAATREDRVKLFADPEKPGEYREIAELSNEEVASAARLFDETFGFYIGKTEIAEYLIEDADRHMMDLFTIDGKSMREYLGPQVSEAILEGKHSDMLKATIIRLATDPKAELKVLDINYDPKTKKTVKASKFVLDVEDRELILDQKPYLRTMDSFKAHIKTMYEDIDTESFTDEHWNELYKHEFHLIARDGLIPSDRIVELDSFKEGTNPVIPTEEVLKHVTSIYGPKQYFVKEWAGETNETEIVYYSESFLNNMKDMDDHGFGADNFAAMAYIASLDPDIITVPLDNSFDESKLPHDTAVSYTASKWTSDIWAMGVGKPRLSMFNHHIQKVNLARESVQSNLETLEAGNAEPLANSLVKGIDTVLKSLKACAEIASPKGDAANHMSMLTKVMDAISSDEALMDAVTDKLSPEQMRELQFFIQLKKLMDDKSVAVDKLAKAERGELTLSELERDECVEAIGAYDRYIDLWAANYDAFVASPDNIVEMQKMLDAKRGPDPQTAEILYGVYIMEHTTIDQKLMEDVLSNSPRNPGMEMNEKLKALKSAFKVKSSNFTEAAANYTNVNGTPLEEGQSPDIYLDAHKAHFSARYDLLEYGKALAAGMTDAQLRNAVKRYNKAADERGWTKIADPAGRSKVQLINSLALGGVGGDSLNGFYNLVFEEIEKTPKIASGILENVEKLKGIDDISNTDMLEYPVQKQINKLKKQNVSRATKDMLDNVNDYLAENSEDKRRELMEYESRIVMQDHVIARANTTIGQMMVAAPQFSDEVKSFVSETVQKMKQYGLITGNSKAEQADKVYSYHKLLDAKRELRAAVDSGNLEAINDSVEAYEKELGNIRAVSGFVKEGIGDRKTVPINLDTMRNAEVPPEFSADFTTDSVMNGIYVLAEQCEKMGVTVEEYMADPVKTVNDYVDRCIQQNDLDSFVNDNMSFAESMDSILSAGASEVETPSFNQKVLGGSVGVTVGRPFDVLAMLETDPDKMLELQKHKLKLTEDVSRKLDAEGMAIESLYRISGMNEKRIGAANLKVLKDGLKAAFIEGRSVRSDDIKLRFSNNRFTVTGESGYKDALEQSDRYTTLINLYNTNKEVAKKASNITKQIIVETMFDYLKEHPEDRAKNEYRELLNAARKAETELMPKYIEGVKSPYDDYKKWQEDFKNKGNELVSEVKSADREFNRQFLELQKQYKAAPKRLIGSNEKADQIKAEMDELIDIRIHELIDGYRHKDITESYLRARYEQLTELKAVPSGKLPELPKFVDESDPELAKKDYALINDLVMNRAWKGHLASVDAYAEWRMNHVVTLNKDGQVEVVEEKNLDVADLTAEEWMLAWKNEIRRQDIKTPLPSGIRDELEVSGKLKPEYIEEKKQQISHEYMEDILTAALAGNAAGAKRGGKVNLGPMVNYMKDSLRQDLYTYGYDLKKEAKRGLSAEDYLTDRIANTVAVDIVTRRGEVPHGMQLKEFTDKLTTDESFRAVVKPLLEAVEKEKKELSEKDNPIAVDMVIKMIEDHVIVNAAAMEQSAKVQRGLTGGDAADKNKTDKQKRENEPKKSGSAKLDSGAKEGDTPDAANPGINLMNKAINDYMTAGKNKVAEGPKKEDHKKNKTGPKLN